MLKENERLDDLEYNNLRIIQNKKGYCFTSDSVLIANLCKVKKGDRVVDIGTGSGVIAILVSAKFQPEIVYGVELQENLSEMAARSVAYNGLEDKVKIINAPCQGIEKQIGTGFDVVVSNPPYDKAVEKDSYTEAEICKSEVFLSAEKTVATAGKLLRFGGLFYMINKSRRMVDVLCAMRANNIEPKNIYLIQPKASLPVDTFIVEGKKGGKPSLNSLIPLIVYEENGEYTEFSGRFYNK